MYTVRPWAALLLSVVTSGSAAAAGGTVTDQAVSLTYAATHWGGFPAADLTGVDVTGDPVFQTGWWYRAEGDTRELPLPTPDSETYSNGELTVVWSNLDGKGFRLEEHTFVFDNEHPSGGFLSYLVATNNNPATRQFAAFHYLDLDMAATSAGDFGTLVHDRFLKFQEGPSRLSYRAPSWVTHYQVAPYPGLRDLLNDAAVTNLSDTGLPFGPGDATAAYQFGPSSIPTGSSYFVGLVSVAFNPAGDHVKGDSTGVGWPRSTGSRPA